MPSRKRHFECTIEDALNDYYYEPNPEDRGKRKKKRTYEPIPTDPPSPPQETQSPHPPLNQLASHAISGPTGDLDTIEHDIGPLPVKSSVSVSFEP